MIESKYFEDISLFRDSWINYTSIITDIQDKDFLAEKFDKFFTDSYTKVYNSVKGKTSEYKTRDLLKTIAEKYVIVENGCLFLHHDIFRAPAVGSFDILKKLRAYYKTNMKKAKGEGRSMEVGFYSLMQQNTKEALNTYYGIMINILSKYYNYDVAGSVTIRGRSTVTVNGVTVEYIFGRYRPYNVSIHLHFINEVVSKKVDWNYWGKWFYEVPVPTDEEILNDLLLHHNDGTYYGKDILLNRIRRLTDNERYLVYYTASFKNCLKLPKMKDSIIKIMSIQNEDYHIAKDILDSGKDLWKVKSILYLDPMSGPEKVKKYFDELDRYFKEILYGYYWYEGDINEYGERLDSTEFIFKNMQRDRIIITDTDSLIIYLDADMDLIKAIPGFKEATSNFEKEMLNYVTGSFIINAVSNVVQAGLERYTNASNIERKYGKEIHYKQEYFFATLQPTKGAKNYIGYISIQEGVLLPTKEIDLKGLSLKKSNFNPEMSSRAKDLVLELIAKKEKPDLKKIMDRIAKDRQELTDMYRSKDNIQMFTISKFKKRYDNMYDYEKGNDRFKAVDLYNHLYPNKEKIKLPGSFKIASVDFKDQDDYLKEAYPDMYDRLIKYNYERLLTKVKCSFRSKIRDKFNIDKKQDITPERVGVAEVLDTMNKIDSINDYDEMKDYLDGLKLMYKDKAKNAEPFNVDLYEMIKKTKLEKAKLEDVTKVALPLDEERVDEFLTEFLATKDTVVYENLISVITEGLGLVTVRNNAGRSTLSNVIAYY